MSSSEQRILTNRQGHPVSDNQNQRTVGARGPATLENYQFLEKISHFDRERIPERVPDPVTFRQEPARIFDFMSQTRSRCTCW